LCCCVVASLLVQSYLPETIQAITVAYTPLQLVVLVKLSEVPPFYRPPRLLLVLLFSPSEIYPEVKVPEEKRVVTDYAHVVALGIAELRAGEDLRNVSATTKVIVTTFVGREVAGNKAGGGGGGEGRG